MARPLRICYPNAFYHVTCRGNERRDIYRDDQDRSLCLEKLKTSLDIYGVRLHAYVLMRNHFHLLVETPKANLSEFMRHFNIAYTGAYNRRHRRVRFPLQFGHWLRADSGRAFRSIPATYCGAFRPPPL